jgi:AcrR family transcriptional regulator
VARWSLLPVYRRSVSATEKTLAERKREVVRSVLASAAASLLGERDYDAITIDEIARAAGVSRRTYFRYYRTKEDVFLAMYEDYGRDVCARLVARPADEAPATALRRAFFILDPTPDRRRVFELAKVTVTVPALHARHLEYLSQWRREVAVELGARCGIDATEDLRPELAVAMATSALDTALGRWVESGDPNGVDELLPKCFALVEDAINAMLGSATAAPARVDVSARA